MGQQCDPPVLWRTKKLTKSARLVPSCQQLADSFLELQRLRLEVRKAEAREPIERGKSGSLGPSYV